MIRKIFLHVAFVLGLPLLTFACIFEGVILWDLPNHLKLLVEVIKQHYRRDIR